MRADATGLAELRRLVTRLESLGAMEGRADVVALLDRSRAVLAASATAALRRPPRRARPRPLAKLRPLLLLALDLACAVLALAAAAGLALGRGDRAEAAVVLGLTLLWLLGRWGGVKRLLAGAWFRLRYGLRLGWLWLAEAFSDRALARLQAMLDAREVMRAWREHRRGLSHTPRLEHVAAFLAEAHGPLAAARFRAAAAARAAPDARPGWCLLISLFEDLATCDALWPEPVAPPAPVPLPPPAEIIPAEPPERAQRRLDLREAIRVKRAEIERAKEWKLKTPDEFAQRDLHLAALRAAVSALEVELRSLGGAEGAGG